MPFSDGASQGLDESASLGLVLGIALDPKGPTSSVLYTSWPVADLPQSDLSPEVQQAQ
jgi:hypothetical protein